MWTRIKDATLILFTNQCVYERRFNRMERELRELTVEVSDALEKMNAWAARLAKREKRALADMAELLEAPEDPSGATITPLPGVGVPSNKYERIRARRAAKGLPPLEVTSRVPQALDNGDENGIRREERA